MWVRRLAAILAAAILPGVSASGEVYVDAPCAGVGTLSWTLTLAGGVSLIFGLNGFHSVVMLTAGLACAVGRRKFPRRAILVGSFFRRACVFFLRIFQQMDLLKHRSFVII